MRKLGWYAVSAVVAAIILGGVLLLAANLYVQSLAVQGQIHRALNANLKMPVEIRKTTVTPWDGLRIDGITARPENGTENFLTASSFRAQFAILPLFHKQIVIQTVLLDQPELSWAQNADGRWQFPPDQTPGKRHGKQPPPAPAVAEDTPAASPATVPPAQSDAAAASPAEVAAVPPSAAPSASPEAKPPRVHRPPAERITVAVDKLKLRHGVLNFLDSQRRPVGRFEDVNVDSKVTADQHASGAVWFDKATLPRAGLSLADFHSDFTYNDKGLTFRNGTADLAGGKIQLEYHIELEAPGSPFSATCHVQNVSLDELIKQAGGRPQLAEGTLQGDIKARGLAGDPDSRRASGQIQLMDAHFANLPLLQSIGEALQIEDISHLQFKKAHLDFKLEGLVVHVQSLELVSNNLQITAQGDYRTDDDRLGLRARLTIDRAVSRQLPKFIESNFQLCGDEAPGSRYMDFDITGSLSKPKSDLFAKVLSGTASNFLQNLLGSKKKHEKKPKHADNSTPPSDQSDGGDSAN